MKNKTTDNIILARDSYKFTHAQQLPPKTEGAISYFECRGGAFQESVFFGLQYYLHNYLEGQVVTREKIDTAAAISAAHFGNPNYFDQARWEHVLSAHNGYLPIRINAVPEGTIVPVQNALFTIEDTDPVTAGLGNTLETLLMKIWHPTTVASSDLYLKKMIKGYLEKTTMDYEEILPFMLHDFGYRGSSSEESALIAGGAHLLNFMGSDTINAVPWIWDNYPEENGEKPMHALSVPAAEHMSITSWGEENETQAYANMLKAFPEGIVSVVSDSYDYLNAVANIWGGTLHDDVLARKGMLVIRPDSGIPKDIVLQTCQIAEEKFGAIKNDKGFLDLHPQIRIIQGDGITKDSIPAIFDNLINHGYAAGNIRLGMGGGLHQKIDRDTMECAIKCCQITVDGQERDVRKKPKTDSNKNSKAGDLALTQDQTTGEYKTVQKKELKTGEENFLIPVFENGKILKTYGFKEIQTRAQKF